jgi:hypothetical protein
MDWRILVFYPEPEAKDKIYNIRQSMLKLKTHPVLSVVRVARSVVLCVVVCRYVLC